MDRRSRRVLVVDDDDHIRESVAETLRRRSHDVTAADCLAAARAALLETLVPFDVVVTDIRLPDGTGLQLAHEIIASLEPRPRVVLITGFLDDPAITALLTNGHAEVLLKPFALRALLQHVNGDGRVAA